MYKIESIESAGGDWWHVRLSNPLGKSIPMKRWRRGATRESIFQLEFDRCFALNVSMGYVKPSEKQTIYRKAYRNWATVRLERLEKEGRKSPRT